MTETTTPTAPAKISYMIGDAAKENGRISFVLNGRFRSYLLASEQGKQLAELLRADPQDIEQIADLADIPTWIAKQTHGRVTVDDCERLRLDGNLVDYGLAGRITKIVEQGADFGALCNFVERVSENPDTSVAEDLYRFLEKGNMPITPEGMILVFKGVDEDYRSFHTGKEEVAVLYADGKQETVVGRIPHPVGGEISLDREICNPNRDQTCSVGIHGCSFEYLNRFYRNRGRTVIGMIDPRDVTAIPNDENDSKLRCCRMKIVDEVPADDAAKHFQAVVDTRYPAEKAAPAPEEAAVEPAKDEDADLLLTDVVAPETDDEPEAGPDTRTAADWAAEGYRDGMDAGMEDRKNGYDYGPSFDVPDEITEDEKARVAYSQAFVTGYDVGFRDVAVEEG